MKRFILILFMVFMPSILFASPFLVCDVPAADQAIESYSIYKDGIKMGTAPAQLNGSLKYDLQGITPGKYIWTAVAVNVWGESALSDPYISPVLAEKPSGVGLSP
jgi:hypothetical protein